MSELFEPRPTLSVAATGWTPESREAALAARRAEKMAKEPEKPHWAKTVVSMLRDYYVSPALHVGKGHYLRYHGSTGTYTFTKGHPDKPHEYVASVSQYKVADKAKDLKLGGPTPSALYGLATNRARKGMAPRYPL